MIIWSFVWMHQMLMWLHGIYMSRERDLNSLNLCSETKLPIRSMSVSALNEIRTLETDKKIREKGMEILEALFTWLWMEHPQL